MSEQTSICELLRKRIRCLRRLTGSRSFLRRVIVLALLVFLLKIVVDSAGHGLLSSQVDSWGPDTLPGLVSSRAELFQVRHAPMNIRPEVKVTAVNCLALMEGDGKERNKAFLHMQFHPFRQIPAREISRMTSDCDGFKRTRGYGSIPVTEEELDFPVAFSIVVHRDLDQVERLLRNIYRAHNFYCIHIDGKSGRELIEAVTSLSRCFPNVFIPPRLESVTYAHFSRLQADIHCMRELIRKGSTWKYVVNLSGQMFPLKTNLEMVKIFQTFEGSNDIEGLSRYVSESMKVRYRNRFKIRNNKLVDSKVPKEPPPHSITPVKGSAYGSFSRPFVQFVLEDGLVQRFLNWSRDIYSPDEFFWATLNSRWVNPMFKSPGGHELPPERKPWMAAYASWKKRDDCAGKFVRDVCIFGVGDLPSLVGRRELFANKFHADFEYLTIDCLEEWLTNKTKHQLPLDLEYYRNVKRLLRSIN